MQTEDFCHCYVIISVLQVIHGEYLLTGLDWTTDWTGPQTGLDDGLDWTTDWTGPL